ncbi:hypothetical protein GGQ58_003639 [Paracoccus denitrificans]|nr:hypothetical protein [Paracoccus denitrificans]
MILAHAKSGGVIRVRPTVHPPAWSRASSRTNKGALAA